MTTTIEPNDPRFATLQTEFSLALGLALEPRAILSWAQRLNKVTPDVIIGKRARACACPIWYYLMTGTPIGNLLPDNYVLAVDNVTIQADAVLPDVGKYVDGGWQWGAYDTSWHDRRFPVVTYKTPRFVSNIILDVDTLHEKTPSSDNPDILLTSMVENIKPHHLISVIEKLLKQQTEGHLL